MEAKVRRVENLTDAEMDKAADVLAHAFEKDFWNRNMIGDRLELNHPFQRAQVAAGNMAGEIYFAELADQLIGVSIWFGPGKEMFADEDQREQCLYPLLGRFTTDVQEFWQRFIEELEKLGQDTVGHHVKLNSYHLQCIGVLPEYQRKGIGSALVRSVQLKAIERGVDVLLECENEDNKAFYEGLGMTKIGEDVHLQGPLGQICVSLFFEKGSNA